MTEIDSDSIPASGLDSARYRHIAAVFGDSVVAALEQVRLQAESTGLNLFHAWSLEQLKDAEIDWLPAQAETTGSNGVLLLFGNAGSDFWHHLQQGWDKSTTDIQSDPAALVDRMINGDMGAHPVDSFTAKLVNRALAPMLAAGPGDADKGVAEYIYPTTLQPDEMPGPVSQYSDAVHHAPLQKLGQLAGCHQPSPLGTGIHPHWGLWYAYRALIWLPMQKLDDAHNEAPDNVAGSNATRAEAQGIARPETDICVACVSKACVSACPGNALTYGSAPDMSACAGYRMKAGSSCADRCLARQACPVNTQQQYPREQVSYHYRKALASLQAYFGDGNSVGDGNSGSSDSN